MKRILTGVKPTGVPHIGNYLGAIRPALELGQKHEAFLFIADLHALTINPDPRLLDEQIYSVAATWLACGLDPVRTVFYRQSDVPEIPELAWYLSCVTPLGFLERAHSVKEATDNKGQAREDLKHGLYAYPVLMAADILAFDTDGVPVGKDQKQHLEITQEIARKFNNLYGEGCLRVPEALIDERVMTVPGLDGRKMSKSYQNAIEIFANEAELKKLVGLIKTNSVEYGQPLVAEGETIFELYANLAAPEAAARLKRSYETGRKDPGVADAAGDTSNYFGWGDAKKALRELLVETFAHHRQEYARLMADRDHLDQLLSQGAAKARAIAGRTLDRCRQAAGLRLPRRRE